MMNIIEESTNGWWNFATTDNAKINRDGRFDFDFSILLINGPSIMKYYL